MGLGAERWDTKAWVRGQRLAGLSQFRAQAGCPLKLHPPGQGQPLGVSNEDFLLYAYPLEAEQTLAGGKQHLDVFPDLESSRSESSIKSLPGAWQWDSSAHDRVCQVLTHPRLKVG